MTTRQPPALTILYIYTAQVVLKCLSYTPGSHSAYVRTGGCPVVVVSGRELVAQARDSGFDFPATADLLAFFCFRRKTSDFSLFQHGARVLSTLGVNITSSQELCTLTSYVRRFAITLNYLCTQVMEPNPEAGPVEPVVEPSIKCHPSLHSTVSYIFQYISQK